MRVFSIAKGFHFVWKHTWPDLEQKELDRLRALRLWKATGNITLACMTFGMSRATLYRWARRFDPKDPTTLKDNSRRPNTLRKPMWSHGLIMAIRALRKEYPRWGKEKLYPLLKQKGWDTSESTVGRIMRYLKQRGEIIEPKSRGISSRKRRPKRPYAVRKPRDYKVSEPGDLVQIDTLDLRPVPDTVMKQFTARDVISKWDVLQARSQATARTASEFLDKVQQRMPFEVKAIQVDGGPEFFSDFERACMQKDIRLFVLPPNSPKLNGTVERANRTHTEEFYEVHDCPWTVKELNSKLLEWEHVYNCVRPHHSLGKKTPLQFLKDRGIIHDKDPSDLSHMY
jgi:transposase InsO family protein